MQSLAPIEPVDYLAIGHITQDLTPEGPMIGGTVSYAALTARAMGLRAGIVTAHAADLQLAELQGVAIAALPAETTTFENIETPEGRIQYVHAVAPVLNLSHVPEAWRNAPIVHLGPVANEIDPNLARAFPDALVGVTPQGWLRAWDVAGRVSFSEWPEAAYVLENATAAVLSIKDVEESEKRIEEMLASIRILAVTEGAAGVRLYWNGDLRRFRSPQVQVVDTTGAGDIFAAAFFIRLHATRDPWEAARCAVQLAACSVTRRGLSSVPLPAEVEQCLIEITQKA